MSILFSADSGPILLSARLRGPRGESFAQLALDTGATTTLVNVEKLVSIGLDPAASAQRVRVTTGSGVEFAPVVPIRRVEALGRQRRLRVIAHTIPPTAGVDRVLGLDLFRRL